MPSVTRHIGLSLGADICWPLAFEQILADAKLDLKLGKDGPVRVRTRDSRAVPLQQGCKYDVVVDRLTHWFALQREWIKKGILMDGLYVYNNPWSVQSYEKHSTYCAMTSLGMPIPPTMMVPQKNYEPKPDLDFTLKHLRAPVRPRQARRADRLPVVHEAVRRRRLAGRHQDRRREGAARQLREQREVADARAAGRRGLRPVRARGRHRPAGARDEVRRQPAAARSLHDGARLLQQGGGAGDGRHVPHHQRLLRLGLQQLRGAAQGRRVLPDRLRQPVPGQPGQLDPLPLAVVRDQQPEVGGVLRGDQPTKSASMATPRSPRSASRPPASRSSATST
jgi:hypothetical protein